MRGRVACASTHLDVSLLTLGRKEGGLMANHFKPGDRVVIRNGESGTVLRVDGGLAHIQLDSSLRKSVAIAALKKVRDDQGSSGPTSSPETSC